MIKVNLLRSRIQDQQATAMNVPEAEQSELKATLVKVGFILCFVLGLMIYESQNIRSLNQQLAQINRQTTEIENQAKAKAREVDAVKDVAERAHELEDKLKIMKTLSRLRLREVKTLDFMQSSIPDKVWLRSIKFTADKDNLDKAQYEFNGFAVTTEDLSDFVKRLEEGTYLGEVIIIKNQETSLQGRGSLVRDFFFTAEVEKSQ